MSLVHHTVEARQHGAMEGSVPPTDLDAVSPFPFPVPARKNLIHPGLSHHTSLGT